METRPGRTGIVLSRHPAPLPIAAEIDTRLVVHRQNYEPVNLHFVRGALVVLPPRRFLCEPNQVRAGDMVMMPDFAPAHPREETLGCVGVDFIITARL